MAEEILISAKLRDKTGRSKSRQVRRNGFIPAVVYGKDIDTAHLLLSEKEIHKTLNKVAGESVLMNLKIEDAPSKKGASRPVIIKEIQQDPATNNILHIDFQAIRLSEKMKIKVPISTKGEAPGVKAGGILEHILREIEVECLPRDIPEKIEINISDLEIGHTVHVKDLTFPHGVVPQEDKENSVVSIVPPKVEEVEVPVEEAVTEPEIIGKEKKEEEEEVKEEAPEKEPSKKAKGERAGSQREPGEKPKDRTAEKAKPDQKK